MSDQWDKDKQQVAGDAPEQPARSSNAAAASASKPRKAAQAEVRVISVKGAEALVEWDQDGMTRRARISPDQLMPQYGGSTLVESSTLESVEQYGVDWESLIKLKATPKTVAQELRRVGIWTLDDLLSNQQAALGAVQAAHALDLATLTAAAIKAKAEEESNV